MAGLVRCWTSLIGSASRSDGVTATWLVADYGGQLCMAKAALMPDNIGDSDVQARAMVCCIDVFVIRVVYIAATWL